MIQGKYRYIPARKEWMALIIETDAQGETHVLDAGCELTEEAVQEWIALAIRNKPWIKGNPPAPDMYDRKH